MEKTKPVMIIPDRSHPHINFKFDRNVSEIKSYLYFPLPTDKVLVGTYQHTDAIPTYVRTNYVPIKSKFSGFVAVREDEEFSPVAVYEYNPFELEAEIKKITDKLEDAR